MNSFHISQMLQAYFFILNDNTELIDCLIII